MVRRKAKGEADAIFAKMDAEARGQQEILARQADGMDALVKAAGTAEEAVQLLIANKIETLVAEQIKAIENIKIDKVTVWDSGADKDGKTATAGFLSGLLKSLPALDDVYKMAGLKLPKIIAPLEADKADPPAPEGEKK